MELVNILNFVSRVPDHAQNPRNHGPLDNFNGQFGALPESEGSPGDVQLRGVCAAPGSQPAGQGD